MYQYTSIICIFIKYPMKTDNKLLLPLWLIVVFLVFVTLYIGKSIIVTILFTSILLFIFSGIFTFFHKYLKYQALSFCLTAWVFLIFFFGIGYIISSQIDAFSWDISKIGAGAQALLEKYSFLDNYLQDFDIMSVLGKIDFAGIGRGALSLISGIIGGLSTVWFLLIFLMLEKNTFAKKFQKILSAKSEKKVFSIYKKIFDDMNMFFLSKFSLALFNAGVSAIIMFFFGLEYALMFALLVFLLDFIPAIWGIIALSLPFLYSFAVFDSAASSFILLVCLFIPQFISGNIIEPKIMGNRLNLSGFVILVALIFWSALWGLVGAFLAVPLMASLNIVFSKFEKTRFIAILFSQNWEI